MTKIHEGRISRDDKPLIVDRLGNPNKNAITIKLTADENEIVKDIFNFVSSIRTQLSVEMIKSGSEGIIEARGRDKKMFAEWVAGVIVKTEAGKRVSFVRDEAINLCELINRKFH